MVYHSTHYLQDSPEIPSQHPSIMYRSVWNTIHQSVCSLNFYNRSGILFSRLSGFKCNRFIITGLCNEETVRANRVVIAFPGKGSETPSRSVTIPAGRLRDLISSCGNNSLSGITVFPAEFEEFRTIPTVRLCSQSLPETGTPVVILAYSCQISQLYMKTGIISSQLDIRGQKLLFIESSFEQGNTGAPLIDGLTGKLIGVMADIFSSPAQKYRKLKTVIEENLSKLGSLTGRYSVGNLDPVQVLSANHHMIKFLARDLYLSSHRCFGFALPVGTVHRNLRDIEHNSQFVLSDGAGS